ncbi:hypothetical protein GAY31_20890 [Azospirillum brasilense]|nr:hypothetical protein [Azospirillum brasilense]
MLQLGQLLHAAPSRLHRRSDHRSVCPAHHRGRQPNPCPADALTDDLRDPYLLSRVLTRREAVSSSGIEGTHSILDERPVVEDTEVDHFAPPPTHRHIRWSGLGET